MTSTLSGKKEIIIIIIIINKKRFIFERKNAFNMKLIKQTPIRDRALPQIGLHVAATCTSY